MSKTNDPSVRNNMIKSAVAGALAAGVVAAGAAFIMNDAGDVTLSGQSTLSSMPLEHGLMDFKTENAFKDGLNYPYNLATPTDPVIAPRAAPAAPAAQSAADWIGKPSDWIGVMPVLRRMEQGQNAWVSGLVDAFDDQNDRQRGLWEIEYMSDMGGMTDLYDAGYAFQQAYELSAGEIVDTIRTTSDSFEKTRTEINRFILVTHQDPAIRDMKNSVLAVEMAVLSGLREASGHQDTMRDAALIRLRDKVTDGHPRFEDNLDTLQGVVAERYGAFFSGNDIAVAAILNLDAQRGTVADYWDAMGANVTLEDQTPEPEL